MDSVLFQDLEKLALEVGNVYSDSSYCVEVFAQRDELSITSILRCQSGIAHAVSDGSPYKKGVPPIGLAWEKPGRFFLLSRPPFRSFEGMMQFYTTEMKMPVEDAQKLSPHLLNVRETLCIGIHYANQNPVVLSVDTLTERGLSDRDGEAIVPRHGKELLNRVRPFAYAQRLSNSLSY